MIGPSAVNVYMIGSASTAFSSKKLRTNIVVEIDLPPDLGSGTSGGTRGLTEVPILSPLRLSRSNARLRFRIELCAGKAQTAGEAATRLRR